MATVAMVFGTYNRLPLLKAAVHSLRAGNHPMKNTMDLIIVDGGSTDGTLEWLANQMIDESDIRLVGQELPLTGAVTAFNLGFRWAVEEGHDFIGHFNDDAVLETPGAIDKAVEMMEADPKIGEVAFEVLGGGWREHVCGKTYANFGVARRAAGIAVAKAQGDPSGFKWWNPIYYTYGADSEFGAWLWKLGYTVARGEGLIVRDLPAMDALRTNNFADGRRDADGATFRRRWGIPNALDPNTVIPT